MLVGSFWFVLFEFGDFAEGLCFSITGMTTAGVVGPLDNDASYMFTTFYVLIGVPLNGYLWGLWADWILEPYISDSYIYYLPQKHPRIFVRMMEWLQRGGTASSRRRSRLAPLRDTEGRPCERA